MSQTYYFVAASKAFIDSEPFDEVLDERRRNYAERNKEIDFFYLEQPAFLETPAFSDARSRIEGPAAALITTDKKLSLWAKVRLEFVETGEFSAPSSDIPDAFAVV